VSRKDFLHTDPDLFHGRELTLHDCVAERIVLEGNILRFSLPDGFWVTTYHNENDIGKVVKTDGAAVAFSVEDPEDVSLTVFIRKRLFWFRWTVVEQWELKDLVEAVNSGRCVLEFITQYRSYYEQMWHCAIRSGKKPWYRECQLFLPGAEAAYSWNKLRPDREW
jgi:hypothetical protein